MSLSEVAHVETWLFDLDNTLYAAETGVMAQVSERMTNFVARHTGLDRTAAYALQKKYWAEHGTTLAGLMAYHKVEPQTFLDDVHDVSLDSVLPDEALNAAIAALPGRKLVFTNADGKHAHRLIDKLGMGHLFEDIFHLNHAGFVPKPNPETFHRLIDRHGLDPRRSLFFEDTATNLKPAHDLGMTTVLVGDAAATNTDLHVHYRAATLKGFLRD